MTPTPSLQKRADRAAIFAAAARKSRKASLAKQKHAVRERALAMIYENRKNGKHYPRELENALRRNH